MNRVSLFFIIFATLVGCTMRGVDTTMTPQIFADGQIVYIYSDLANFAQPDQDPEAEKLRLRDLDDWMVDVKLCPNGYEIIKRQAVPTRAWSQGRKVYYFIRCK
jgi:hypothetical protein